jgi:hypothetical protein
MVDELVHEAYESVHLTDITLDIVALEVVR